MNATVRAHRILVAMANYQKTDQMGGELSELVVEQPGKPIGVYRNPGGEGFTIGVFTEGLVWSEKNRQINLRFTEYRGSGITKRKGK